MRRAQDLGMHVVAGRGHSKDVYVVCMLKYVIGANETPPVTHVTRSKPVNHLTNYPPRIKAHTADISDTVEMAENLKCCSAYNIISYIVVE